jgi:DNA primase
MKFPPSLLDEIKARIPVSQVVSRKVKLTRRGREFVGLSPFNPEKTPSFTVNDQKGFYHCFSSGRHGDIFGFLTEVEGLTFPEAVERLAGEAGIPMPERTHDDAVREERRAGLIDVMEMAAAFYERQLQEPGGAAARGYLADRGLAGVTQKAFRLGFAGADRYALKTHLTGLGVDQQQQIEAGLLIAGDDIPVAFDRFRDRVMFPITDHKGRVIAFGGRAMAADAPAKYLNSPETPLFHKGSVLYNFAGARKAAYDSGTMIAVEGYMDVIALNAAGFAHVVAPLGTALTPDQVQLMWRVAPEPVLCFDGDKAGLKAAFRAVETVLPLLKPGYSVRFALLPDNLDPDDLVRTRGRGAMDEVLAAARPLADMLWMRELEGGDWSTPERRALLESRIDDLLATIGDAKVRRHYEASLRDRLRRHWGGGRNAWSGPQTRRGAVRGAGRWKGQERPRRGAAGGWDRGPEPSSEYLKASALVRGGRSSPSVRERLLILGVVNHPDLLDRYAEEFAAVEFTSRELDSLRAEILDIAAHCVPLDRRTLWNQLDNGGMLALIEGLKSGLAHKSDWFVESDAAAVDAETGWRHMLALHRKSLTLQKELMAAELAAAQDGSDENYQRLKDIRMQILATEGTEATVEGYGEASRARIEADR